MGIRAPGCVFTCWTQGPSLPCQGWEGRGAAGEFTPLPGHPDRVDFSVGIKGDLLWLVSPMCASICFPEGPGFRTGGKWSGPLTVHRSAPCRRLQAGEEEVSVRWGGCWALWGLAYPGDRGVPRCEWQWAWPGTCSPLLQPVGVSSSCSVTRSVHPLGLIWGSFWKEEKPGPWPGVPCPLGPGDLVGQAQLFLRVKLAARCPHCI